MRHQELKKESDKCNRSSQSAAHISSVFKMGPESGPFSPSLLLSSSFKPVESVAQSVTLATDSLLFSTYPGQHFGFPTPTGLFLTPQRRSNPPSCLKWKPGLMLDSSFSSIAHIQLTNTSYSPASKTYLESYLRLSHQGLLAPISILLRFSHFHSIFLPQSKVFKMKRRSCYFSERNIPKSWGT